VKRLKAQCYTNSWAHVKAQSPLDQQPYTGNQVKSPQTELREDHIALSLIWAPCIGRSIITVWGACVYDGASSNSKL
jgi:hypothetical protein